MKNCTKEIRLLNDDQKETPAQRRRHQPPSIWFFNSKRNTRAAIRATDQAHLSKVGFLLLDVVHSTWKGDESLLFPYTKSATVERRYVLSLLGPSLLIDLPRVGAYTTSSVLAALAYPQISEILFHNRICFASHLKFPPNRHLRHMSFHLIFLHSIPHQLLQSNFKNTISDTKK